MDKIVELNREYWGRVHDMCEGTELEDAPWECVKREVVANFYNHPKFSENPDYYEFAVAVLEGKPVFVGDTIYDKCDGQKMEIISIDKDGDMVAKNQAHKELSMHFHPDDFTWTPPAPKRIFTLNGFELPCPDQAKHDFTQEYVEITNVPFFFDKLEDARKVKDALVNLLTEARDKP